SFSGSVLSRDGGPKFYCAWIACHRAAFWILCGTTITGKQAVKSYRLSRNQLRSLQTLNYAVSPSHARRECLARLLLRNLRSFLACFRQADCDGLLAAFHSAAFTALAGAKRAMLSAPHCALSYIFAFVNCLSFEA